MAKGFRIITAVLTVSFLASLLCYCFLRTPILLTLTITSGVFTYHFAMRLAVGLIINAVFHNDIRYELKWFRPHRFEKKLYSFLKVKRWKEHIPTYMPEAFSVERGLIYIAKATCQAELVHEIIIALSFAPMLLAIPFGDFFVFASTSLAAALVDTVFVIIQRYNRPRLVKIISKTKK